jgi:hypothetical protein
VGVQVLVDFDNIVRGDVPSSAPLASLLDRMVGLALDLWPDARRIDIRMFGGWLEDGVLTRRGSELQAAVASARFFPFRHPSGPGLLRGSVELATRLAAVPDIQWNHTLRERVGLPRVRFRDGTYPNACVHVSQECPLRAMRRFSTSHGKECSVAACSVTNAQAFRAPEQKMVDVMIGCDIVAFAATGARVLVLSSDMDVLPAAAMAATMTSAEVAIWRVARYSADLYVDELTALGVEMGSWDGE